MKETKVWSRRKTEGMKKRIGSMKKEVVSKRYRGGSCVNCAYLDEKGAFS
jgi:hypothetical protein